MGKIECQQFGFLPLCLVLAPLLVHTRLEPAKFQSTAYVFDLHSDLQRRAGYCCLH